MNCFKRYISAWLLLKFWIPENVFVHNIPQLKKTAENESSSPLRRYLTQSAIAKNLFSLVPTMGIWQLTMAIIKPHIIKNPVACVNIRELILSSNFKIVLHKRKIISTCEAEDFYSEHRQKFFYNRLLTFITSGPSDIMVLTKENAIAEWRQLMGPTKVFRAQFEAPNTIRGRYGLTDTRNATHGSDSEQSVEREIKIFFPEFDVQKWYRDKEPYFRSNQVSFSKDHFRHEIVL